MQEINKNYFCSAGGGDLLSTCECLDGEANQWYCEKQYCKNCHRKHPTPRQFAKEYGFEYSDDGPVWFRCGFHDVWCLLMYKNIKDEKVKGLQIVCACTPWGKPLDDWRPK